MRESESDRRARRKFRRTFALLCLIGLPVLLVLGKAALPADTSVTSNAPVTTRTLDPRVFPTTAAARTVAATTTTPTVVATAGELIVIDGDHVYRLPRTQAVALYLWLALQNGS